MTMTIDMHSHIIPKGLADALRARTKPPMMKREADGKEYMNSLLNSHAAMTEGFDSVEKRLEEMDKNGVTHAVLSNQMQDISSLPLEDSVPLCRAYNDAISAACVKYPDRLTAFAAIPVGSVEAATAEFERAMSLPGIIGCIIPGDAFLSAKRAEKFAPLLEAADRRRAVILAHYGRLPNDPEAPQPDLSDNRRLRIGTLDMQARISSSMMTFCLTDFIKKYPNVTMMTHNLGGNIPFEVERMDHRAMVDDPGQTLPSKRFREGHFICDCNSLGPRSIEMAVGVYGADKIVFGSDGTHFGMDWTQKAINEARISDAEKDLIRGGNAARAIARVTSRFAVAAQ
ncbi:MAG TPA: amidohydrolase family protein [Stellaceae bacterium]|nr:amidohydrolase family protein [Stellaceae bacterium]